MRRIWIIMALSLALVFGLAMQAAADTTFTSTFTVTNTSLAPDFAELTITVPDGGGAATFNINADDSYLFGDVYLNLTNTDVTLSAPAGYSAKGPQNNISIFGDFNYTLGPPSSGFSDAVTSLSFVLTPDSGSFADASSVLTLNSNVPPYLDVIHIFNSDGSVTGFAGEVPLPPSALLMGSGLLGLLGFGWRRKVRS
jgi:hypothetical protein